MKSEDYEREKWVQIFNKFDLYLCAHFYAALSRLSLVMCRDLTPSLTIELLVSILSSCHLKDEGNELRGKKMQEELWPYYRGLLEKYGLGEKLKW